MFARLCPIALLASGCVIGAPPGFSSGDHWSFPLVAPFEHTAYLIPVKVNDTGPYLFKVDPDSAVSSIDSAIVNKLQLHTTRDREQIDERDKRVPVALAEVRRFTIGTLSIRNLTVRVHNVGTYWEGGRRVRGVLGRDVIADSLIFRADRDTAMAYLATKGHMTPPATGTALKYKQVHRRKLHTATVNGSDVVLHLDLGGHTSSLWPSKMRSLGLVPAAQNTTLVDEFGTKHQVRAGAVINTFSINGKTTRGMLVLPYLDKRRREVDLDGTLGQNFFAQYNVTADWHRSTIWLSPSTPQDPAKSKRRLARWGNAFDGCSHTACARVEVGERNNGAIVPIGSATQPANPTPPVEGAPMIAPKTPTYVLRIHREKPELPTYELLLDAVDENGKTLGLPYVVVTLPKGPRYIESADLPQELARAAALKVVDASPFARDCQPGGGCVWHLPRRH